MVLDPDALEVRGDDSTCPSRRSPGFAPTATSVYVVGTSTLFRVALGRLRPLPRRRVPGAATAPSPGQTYGWDPVIALGAAWFLDDGEGSERYVGTLRGQGRSTAPLHLVRVDLATGAVHAHRGVRAARTA